MDRLLICPDYLKAGWSRFNGQYRIEAERSFKRLATRNVRLRIAKPVTGKKCDANSYPESLHIPNYVPARDNVPCGSST